MEIFHRCYQYTPLNLSDFIYVTFFAHKCLKMKLWIDMQNLKKNAQVSI